MTSHKGDTEYEKFKVWELLASDSQTSMLYNASMESQSEVSYTEALNNFFTETGYLQGL